MASTNKTTNYDLSQYIGTDKPTYLVDYNQDMAKIDAGITGAKSVADANAVNIGDLEDLTTTSKADLVNAINEVDSDLSTVSSQVGDNTSDIGALQGDVGNKSNLNTTDKSNLVSAINEVNSKGGSLSNLNTNNKTDLVSAINELVYNLLDLNLTSYSDVSSLVSVSANNESGTLTLRNPSINVAKNNSGSIAKLYGSFRVTANGSHSLSNLTVVSISDTGLRPESQFTVNSLGMYVNKSNYALLPINVTFNTNGSVSIAIDNLNANEEINVVISPCLIYVKDFGDIPVPSI